MTRHLQRDRELGELWERCAGGAAVEADWNALYRLVLEVLMHCNAPELSGLSGDRRDYVDTYFAEKIFLSMKPGSRPFHCGALVLFFRRWLRDRLDESRGNQWLPDTQEGERDSGTEGGREEVEVSEDLTGALREYGKSVEEVGRSAEEFLRRLRREDEWAWLMLRYGFFAEPDERIPLKTLAEKHAIPAYHYRAARLGIVHSGDGGVDLFRGTILGSWVEQSLGQPVSAGMENAVWAAIEILGFQALRV